MSFKRVFAAAAALSLALVTSAFGQAGIQLGAGQVLGNSTAAQRPGRAESVTAILDRALGSTRGAIIERGVGGWGLLSPSATARVPYLSGGAGADPLYGAYTLPASVTSGGVACFTSTTVEASSALLSANAIVLGGGAGVCPSPMGSLGTTTTVLHGNAGGPPTFAAVVSADLNITATSCTNQFVTAISTGGVGTCTTPSLTSPSFANQGTTATVLHGNAGGNPSFGPVNLTTEASGTLQAAQEPAHTGGCTNSAGSLALSCVIEINFPMGNGPGCGTPGSNSTVYSGPNGCWSATENDASSPISKAMTLKNLRVKISTSPVGAETVTVTLRKNGAATGSPGNVTCQITGAATTCSDLTNVATYSAADTVDIQIVHSTSAVASITNTQLTSSTTTP